MVISGEPLINAIHRRLLDFLLCGLVFFLVYACFVPFDFCRPQDRSQDTNWLLGLRLQPISLPDIIANITIYVPIGVLACAVLRRRKFGRIVSLLMISVAGAALSFAVEYGQHFVRSRVPSWVDVTSNILGVILGAAFVIIFEGTLRRRAAGALEEARRHWWLTAGRVFVCVVLFAQLRPYDVVVDCFHTAADTYRHGSVDPLKHWRSLSSAQALATSGTGGWSRAQWEYALDCLVDSAMYAAISAIVILGQYRSRRSTIRLFLWSGFVATSLAGLITSVRIFLISYGLDTAHFACSLIGWPVGTAIGLTLSRRRFAQPFVVSQSHRGWVALAGCCLAAVGIYELVPFDFAAAGTGGTSRPCLLPFLAHFHSKPNVALYDISGDLLRYMFFGGGIAVLLWARYGVGQAPPRLATSTADGAPGPSRLRWRFQLMIAMGGAMIAAALFETAHIWMPSRQSDVTTIIMAMIGSFTGAVAVRWVIDVRRSLAVAFANDLLTSQLIVGETYTPIPTPQKKSDSSTPAARTSTNPEKP